MSHRHSFNTQPRKRVRQMHASERWDERIKECAKEINSGNDIEKYWSGRAEVAHQQRDILKHKLGY